MDAALVFSVANNLISLCLPDWEVLTALLKLIVELKKKCIQRLAQQHLNGFKWLKINLLCHLSYFEEEEIGLHFILVVFCMKCVELLEPDILALC